MSGCCPGAVDFVNVTSVPSDSEVSETYGIHESPCPFFTPRVPTLGLAKPALSEESVQGPRK